MVTFKDARSIRDIAARKWAEERNIDAQLPQGWICTIHLEILYRSTALRAGDRIAVQASGIRHSL